jgi:hypothetical protein
MSGRQDYLPPVFVDKKPPRGEWRGIESVSTPWEGKTGAGSPNSDGVMLWRLIAPIRRCNASWVRNYSSTELRFYL